VCAAKCEAVADSDSGRDWVHGPISSPLCAEPRAQDHHLQPRQNASRRIVEGSRTIDRRSQRPARPLEGPAMGRGHRQSDLPPGLIVGPRDETDRFTYWPVRIDRGGEVLAPGEPGDPVQFIDARDLAEWTIRMVEKRETGIYNATGPAKKLGVGEMLSGIKEA